MQTLLVALDGEHVVAALIADSLGGVHLCVHGVGGDHYPVHAQRFEQDRQGGDLWLDLSATRARDRTVNRLWRTPRRSRGAVMFLKNLGQGLARQGGRGGGWHQRGLPGRRD